MNLRGLSSFLTKRVSLLRLKQKDAGKYQPTFYLNHPLLQSIYNLAEPKMNLKFYRQKLFFEDGGHISLDWAKDPSKNARQDNPPILFIMHGLTGGSEMNYIKSLMSEASTKGYETVCMNSRGINNEMTSPIPFTGFSHSQLSSALERVKIYYPNSPIYMLGTSFGGNYILRYLMKNIDKNIKGVVALAPPFDVRKVVDDMPPIYQKFFVKRYIEETVTKHPQMLYWAKIGLINMEEVLKSNNLHDFHSRVTAKILGVHNSNQVFQLFKITPEQIQSFNIPTFILVSKDDPIVSYQSFPLKQIKQNKNIQLLITEKGGHLCWFHGIRPKRWYPKPTFEYLSKIRQSQ